MNLNRIGIVIYRAALIGSIVFVGITLRQMGSQLRHPLNVNASIGGDVSVTSSSALDVNIEKLAPVDFEKNAFLAAGALDVSVRDLPDLDFRKNALILAGPLDVSVSDLPPLDFTTGASLIVEHLP